MHERVKDLAAILFANTIDYISDLSVNGLNPGDIS